MPCNSKNVVLMYSILSLLSWSEELGVMGGFSSIFISFKDISYSM